MLDFPNSPTVGQIYPSPATAGIPQWRWDGAEWVPYTSFLTANMQVKRRLFFASATYVPTPGLMFADVTCQGPGGGGGGVAGVASNNANGGGGGSSGTTSGVLLTAAQIGAGVAMTIPAAGVGGAAGANPGASGSTCSFGSFCTAPGGLGGAGPNGVGSIGAGGTPNAAGTGDWSIVGESGGAGMYVSGVAAGSIISNQNRGGSSPWGTGGRTAAPGSSNGVAGGNAFGYGAGGGGAIFQNIASNFKGGDGSPALIQVMEYGNFGSLVIPSGYVQRGMLAGFTLSTAGSSATFGIGTGQCADSNAGDYMVLTSAWTKTTAAWAAGSGNGALDTGSIAASAWYHVFIIKNPTTGAVDVLVSLSPSVPTLPSGYTLARRIGSMATVSSQWIKFSQLGDEFLWDANSLNVNGATGDTLGHLAAVGVPPGIQVWAMLSVIVAAPAGGSAGRAYISSPDKSDEAPTASALNVGVFNASTISGAGNIIVRTNTSQQIRYRCEAAGTSIYISANGWIDTRGRLA